MYLADAKEILENEYHKRYAQYTKDFQKEFMDEKIKHSYQVLGAGNFILNHEPCFAKCSHEEKEYLQAMVLLHDVARFYEILEIGEGRAVDHGVCGAEMLSKISEFSAIDVRLPIKHHGHLIGALYEDEEYQSLSPEMQDKVRRNAFLVRDADKLANFYLLASHFEDARNVFFQAKAFEHPYNKNASSGMLDKYNAHCTSIARNFVTNFADKALFFAAWIYDLNYASSFEFMRRLRIVPRMFEIFSQYWNPEDYPKYLQTMEDYITKRVS